VSEEYKYNKEKIASDGDDQIWNYPKTKEYFDECFSQLSVFNLVSTALATGLNDFINDDDHTGYEADVSKAFVNEKVFNSLVATVRAVQILQGKMQGKGFEESTPLLEDFKDTLNENEKAIVKTSKLKSVIQDFSDYYTTFSEKASTISTQREEAKKIISGCALISSIVVEKPDPSTSNQHFKDFVSMDGTEGFVPTFLKDYLAFLEAHNDDFSTTEFEQLIDQINKNLDAIISGLKDGSFNPDTYEDDLGKIDYDQGENLDKLETYISEYKKYLQGMVPREQVYDYDPINMNSGNFISKKTDLIVHGPHSLMVERFYNAQSNVIGAMGRGWTLNYDEHISKAGNGYKLYSADGKECVYEPAKLGNDDVYLEIHGEPGVLSQTEDGFRLALDEGKYKEFDKEGYLLALGDGTGNHTTIDYNIFEKITDGKDKAEKVALPIRITTKEGTSIVLSYNDKGLLVMVKDHAGRKVSYKYEDANDPFKLTSVETPNGKVRSYTYNEEGLITSATREDGVVGVVNEYDGSRRVTRQTMPDGRVYCFSYDDEKHVTHAVEPNGYRIDYLSDELGRHVGTVYPDLGVSERFVYNNKGQRISHTDKNGYTTRYTYDNRGHVTSIIGPEGYSEFFTYNADGRLYSRKDAEGNVTKFTYDLDGNLYSVTSPLGEKVKLDYENGRVTAIKNADGELITLTYDGRGNISSIVDPSGVRTEYECDILGRVIATRNADGGVTRYDLDEDDNITRVTDPEGNVTVYEYNKLGKVAEIVNPDGTRKTWQYNISGKPSAYVDEDSRTTRVYYNVSGKEERIILPNNGSISYEYDLSGKITKVIDPNGNETCFTYDNEGHVTSITKGDDEIVSTSAFTYDGLGRRTSESDGNGNVLRYQYDKNGNVVSITDALGGVTKKEYDAIGRLVKEVDKLGRETLYTYDRLGNVLTETDAHGVVTQNFYSGNKLIKVVKRAENVEQVIKTIEYDNCGRIKEVTEADGYRITYGYNKNGEIVSVSGSDGRSLRYTRDSRGRVIQVNDSGKVTSYKYTGTGQIKCVTDALGNRAEYTYNALDLIEKVERFGDKDSLLPKVDETGHVTSYEYDLAGRLVSVTDALGKQDTYSYDALGFLKKHVDRDGYETVYTRDGNGNVIGIDYKDGKSVKLNYNALNILEEVQDYLGFTRIESDILGRTSKVTDHNGRTVSYEYGAYDQKTSIVYPDGYKAEYKYDAFGRLKNVDDVSYEYDEFGRLSEKIFPNGIRASYEYYQGGLLKAVTSSDSTGLLDEYLYRYDSSSMITDITRNRRGMESVSGAYHYEYDGIGRLTRSTHNGQLMSSYEYDAFGNRKQMVSGDSQISYEYDVLDRLTSSIIKDSSNREVVNSYSYDNRGNRTAMRVGDVLKKTFSFDARGNMVLAKDADSGSISFSYNGLGTRVGSLTSEEKTEYLVDVSRNYKNLLGIYANGVSEHFVYGDELLSMKTEGDTYYFLQDELGSPTYLTGTDGGIVNAYAYDDFGRNIDPYTGKRRRDHAYAKSGNIIQPFSFTGYQEDCISGLSFAQARYYDPNTGRFNAEDSIHGFVETPETFNHYEYCFNNPIEYVDLDGRFPSLSDIKKGISDFADNAKQAINDNRHIIGAGITILGAVGGVVATVALTPCLGPVGAKAVGGAITGGLTDLGAQVTQHGTDVNWAQVGINAAGGALSAAIPGSGVLGAVKDAAIDGAVELGSQLVRGEKPDFREVGKTMAISFGTSVVADMFGNFFNRRRNQEIDITRKRNSDIVGEIDDAEGLLDHLKSPRRLKKTKNLIKRLTKEIADNEDLIEELGVKNELVSHITGNFFGALTNLLLNDIAYEVC